ncbi:hypothetical protein JZ751_003266 [Albula glossodonta]|uniref:Uncharacterized protein n=1 Tax=Albula glossodonta TaxID=121402 RepID=A0A8T2NHV4_9TELE|nr:hypothetical protein JZ751_003266 [Albula glossodonta]
MAGVTALFLLLQATAAHTEPGDGPNTAVMTTVTVVIVLGLVFGIVVFVIYKRRCKGSQTSPKPVYTAAEASHSLWAFATLITGETQFPEFTAVTMVDDVQELRERHHYTCSVTHLTLDNKLDISWEPGSGPNVPVIITVVTVVVIVLVLFAMTAFIICKRTFRGSQSSLKPVYTAAKEDRDDDSIYEDVQFVTETAYNSMKRRSQQIKFLNNHTEGVHVYQRLVGCVLDNDKEGKTMERDAYNGIAARSYNMWNYTFNPLWPVLMFSQGQIESILMEYTNIYQPICTRTLKHYLKKVKNVVLRKERPRVRLLHNTHPETGEPGSGPNVPVIITVVTVVVLVLVLFAITAFIICKRTFRGSQTSLKPVYTAAKETEDSASNSSTT